MTQDVAQSRYDVVVLGAGMGGLSAAASAAQSGARVLVLERAPVIGGSAALSHGNVWTVADVQQLPDVDPGEYRAHASEVVGDFAAATDWLATFGGALEPRGTGRRRQARRFDIPLTFLRMAQALGAAGGDMGLDASVTEARAENGGFAVRVQEPAGSRTVFARALVLATGGRQADPSVRVDLASGADALLRGNAYSDGGGVALGLSLGASANLANKGFYGHLMPVGVRPLSGIDLLALTMYHSTNSVLLDRAGMRFTDESNGDARNAIALARHGGIGLLLWSAEVQVAAALDPAPVDIVIDRWTYAAQRGAQVGRAATVAGVVDVVRRWGYRDLPALGDSEVLRRLGAGPVYLARVGTGITFTYGGLRADETGAVLDDGGRPIRGLFVAGADMSDVYHLGYAGGLSAALVTGLRAGRSASRAAAALRDALVSSPARST